MTGTTLAQAIPVMISPILTRLYTPQEFGVFAFYLALVSVLSVLATGRYELAIMVPRKERGAAAVTVIALYASILTGGILFLVVALFGREIANLFNMSEHYQLFYWMPLSVVLMAGYQALNYWCNRRSYYRPMAAARMSQSVSMSAAQVGSGYASVGVSGLVGGAIAGHFSAFLFLLVRVLKSDKQAFGRLNFSILRAMARRYIDFPKYLIAAHSLNMASFQAPIIALGSMFGSSVSGFFMLTQRVIGAPMSIVASAIGDVFRQEAGRAYSETGQCKEIYEKTFLRLLCIAVPAFPVFFFIAPELFALIFGESWRVSGEYARILTPMFFLQFVTTPLSSMYMLAQKQRLDLIWQFSLFLLIISSFALAHLLESITAGLYFYSLSYSIMYLVNGILSYRLARGAA
jgi:O-antigen/teichoic acid export membrane protein